MNSSRIAKVVVIGDSLTELGFRTGGWASQLTAWYTRKADVFNRGLSGYNTEWVARVLDDLLDGLGALGENHLFLIFLGANDSALDGGGASRKHVPLSRFEENLGAIVMGIRRSAPKARLLFLTPLPVTRVEERTNATVKQYAAAVLAAAGRLSLPAVDLWAAASGRAGWEAMLSDGLHLAPSGERFVFETVALAIKEHCPDFHPDTLPVFCPPFESFAKDGDSAS
ncbi:GDSL esterase/lipase [Diplonema papillatum]|nr:GDSL esterase/lipase [Diplonema papillatum]